MEGNYCDCCGLYDSAYEEGSETLHVASTKHKCNFILQQFRKNRKQFRGNRNGVVVVCSTQSSFDTAITNDSKPSISLSARPNEEVKFIFKIMNETRSENMSVMGIHLAHPQPQFTMSDHGIEFTDEPYALPPKSTVDKDVTVTFRNSEIAHFEMPIIFTVKTDSSGKKTIIVRELIVFVEEAKTVHEKTVKSPFTAKSIFAKKTISSTNNSQRNNMFSVPRSLKGIFGSALKVKDSAVPEERALVIEVKNIFKTGAEGDNYVRFFHHLLWYEETVARIQLKKYNMSGVEMEKVGELFKLLVPGLAEKRPSLLKGDEIFIRPHGTEDHLYVGRICEIEENFIFIHEFGPQLLSEWRKDTKFDVRFILSRMAFERMHLAVQQFAQIKNRVLPKPNQSLPKIEEIESFYSNDVASNPEQRTAVEHIVAGTSGAAPYMVFGPPGTGKTVTIVEAILQLVKKNSSNRILVCTDSNMAADHIACAIVKHASQVSVPKLLYRANSKSRVWETLPEQLRQYSNGHNSETCFNVDNSVLSEYSIVVTTLLHVAVYFTAIKQHLEGIIKMTHLFIDEAAQASEPACLIPITGMMRRDGHLILAGDPKQLGPVCMSRQAAKEGLGMSLMERLKEKFSFLYKTDNDPDPNYITMLKKNYRSHPDIILIPNQLFYEDHLTPHAEPDPLSDLDILNDGTQLSRAIVFHAVNSREQREGKSPSYFNMKEIEMVKVYVRALVNTHKVATKDIGIVTPYTRQMYKVRAWLKGQSIKDLEVGTVEAFQGKEKRVIIITTVRANCKLLDYDAKYQLGFLVDDKRFNVAITRAKAKAIVIGNPACLCRDAKWRRYMETCSNFRSYYGKESEQLERTTAILKEMAITRFDRNGISEELKRMIREKNKTEKKSGESSAA